MISVRIVTGPIDEDSAVAEAERPSNGAMLVFRGIVRDHHAGRAVDRIDYQAYESMAETELRRVAEAAAREHGIEDLVVVHRIGQVRVGEASLLVVAGAPHRRPVFDGVLALVDELKRTVPIWKKEFGPDGASWVEGVLPAPPPES